MFTMSKANQDFMILPKMECGVAREDRAGYYPIHVLNKKTKKGTDCGGSLFS